MDKAFEKFGIYDFLGIWIPGALTVTYYLFTLRIYTNKIFGCFDIDLSGIPINFLLVILYTAVAYFLGVILHEVGKILADFIPCFRTDDINTRIYKKVIHKRPNGLFRKIKYEYQQVLMQNNTLPDNKNKGEVIEFDKAISSLKYDKNISTKRIDTYHSVYALSRSLCLCFLGHAIILVFVHWNLFLLITDAIMALLFFERSYRYFHSWVKNVYLQYYKSIEDSRNESDQTTKTDI